MKNKKLLSRHRKDKNANVHDMAQDASPPERASSAPLRCVELYCGIGCLHAALKRVCPSAVVVAAYDVSPLAADVYESNYGLRPSGRDIRALSGPELDAHNADLWLLSPPCQPYTRNGLQLGSGDGRAGSLGCLAAALLHTRRPPRMILLENVVGFERSDTHASLRQSLAAAGYSVHEYTLSPSQLGVPYSRPRRWLLAAHGDAGRALLPQPQPRFEWPPVPRAPVSSFLDDSVDWAEHAVPWAAVRTSLRCVDFTCADSEADVNCVTKSYGRYAKGTGSVVVRAASDVARLFDAVSASEAEHTRSAEAHAETHASAAMPHAPCAPAHIAPPAAGGWPRGSPELRYLTPSEVARLHGLPEGFVWPPSVTRLQRYALLGNSLSVDCAAELLRHFLLKEPAG